MSTDTVSDPNYSFGPKSLTIKDDSVYRSIGAQTQSRDATFLYDYVVPSGSISDKNNIISVMCIDGCDELFTASLAYCMYV